MKDQDRYNAHWVCDLMASLLALRVQAKQQQDNELGRLMTDLLASCRRYLLKLGVTPVTNVTEDENGVEVSVSAQETHNPF